MDAKSKTAKKDRYIVLWSECDDDSQWMTIDRVLIHASEAEARGYAEKEAKNGTGGKYAVLKFIAEGNVRLIWK